MSQKNNAKKLLPWDSTVRPLGHEATQHVDAYTNETTQPYLILLQDKHLNFNLTVKLPKKNKDLP